MKHCLSTAVLVLLLAVSLAPVAGQDDQAPRPAGLKAPYCSDLAHHQFEPPPLGKMPQPDTAQLLSRIKAGKLHLSLNEAIELAVRNNLGIQLQRLEIRDRHEAAYQSESPFEPVWNQNWYFEQDNAPSPSTVQGIVSNWTRELVTSQTLSKYLPTGSTLQADFSFGRYEANASNVFFTPNYQGRLTLSFSQHLLRGRGREANLAPVYIARNNWKIAESDFRMKLEELVLALEKQYWDMIYAQSDLEVKVQSLQLAQKTCDDTRAQVEAGTAPELNLFKARAESARRQQDVISAQTALKNLQQAFLSTMTPGAPPVVGPALALEIDKLDPRTGETPEPLEKSVERALRDRADMQSARIGVENAEIGLKLARNNLKPLLDFSASYTNHGMSGSLRDLSYYTNPIPQPIIDAMRNEFAGVGWGALGEMFNGRFNGFRFQFSLEVPFGNLDARAGYARAAIGMDKQRTALDQVRQQIMVSLQTAYNNLERDRGLIEATREERIQAEKDLEGEQAKFLAGVSVIRDLLESQRNLAEALSLEISSRIQYRKSMLDYYFATSQLLEHHGIQVAPALRGN